MSRVYYFDDTPHCGTWLSHQPTTHTVTHLRLLLSNPRLAHDAISIEQIKHHTINSTIMIYPSVHWSLVLSCLRSKKPEPDEHHPTHIEANYGDASLLSGILVAVSVSNHALNSAEPPIRHGLYQHQHYGSCTFCIVYDQALHQSRHNSYLHELQKRDYGSI
jgi:hypothetical protein